MGERTVLSSACEGDGGVALGVARARLHTLNKRLQAALVAQDGVQGRWRQRDEGEGESSRRD